MVHDLQLLRTLQQTSPKHDRPCPVEEVVELAVTPLRLLHCIICVTLVKPWRSFSEAKSKGLAQS
jgi:hypothetical protein